ncbi:MAG: hypothetical protein EXR67_00135 [Dehalococcoidia bacterium]|nr:hypothetical protein [Dehalococcoidia bacterium]
MEQRRMCPSCEVPMERQGNQLTCVWCWYECAQVGTDVGLRGGLHLQAPIEGLASLARSVSVVQERLAS